MLIQSLEQKTRLAMITVLATIVGCVVICCTILFLAFNKISEERQQIYILDGQIPFLAERAELETTYDMEAQAHINMFHQYFFNLPPDNEYIDFSIGKAMYLADASALKQKKSMEEKGFFSDLVSSSAVCSIICDSIKLDHDTNDFTFYGRQLIKRRTSQIRRSMITTGKLYSVPRSKNNPHGLMIVNWRTLENKDIK
ncbi:MAG: conjugative transposon protein TraK [Bacteroidales bacterium]|nr:conjugative transposon protein TraK [Bacteroidales bacterium]